MGRGRVKALLVCLGALALTAAGCGVETHENAGRPAVATRISVAVSDNSITVQPSRIGSGPEPTQQIPQNHDASQPQVHRNEPLTVAIVAANLTDSETKLVLRGPREVTLDPLVANGNGTLLTNLDEGIYTISAAGLPKATPAKLAVGSFRTSSQNDVLLP
jgi:hypothetical protein